MFNVISHGQLNSEAHNHVSTHAISVKLCQNSGAVSYMLTSAGRHLHSYSANMQMLST